MAAPEAELQNCDGCGATIYPEHLERHAADRLNGKLYCPHCIQEQRAGVSATGAGDALRLAEGPELASEPRGPSAVTAARERTAVVPAQSLRRPLLTGTSHATRCRTFHCKLTDASISHMDQQINEWIDQHEDVQVKFATSTVGVVEGKHHDPHLIVTIYY